MNTMTKPSVSPLPMGSVRKVDWINSLGSRLDLAKWADHEGTASAISDALSKLNNFSYECPSIFDDLRYISDNAVIDIGARGTNSIIQKLNQSISNLNIIKQTLAQSPGQ